MGMSVILVIRSVLFIYTLIPPLLAKRFQRRRCLNTMEIHMYIAPGVGADDPLGSNYFQNYEYLVLLPIS